MTKPPTIGLLTSVGQTLDAFFPAIVNQRQRLGHKVLAAAGTPAQLPHTTAIRGLTRRPGPTNITAVRRLRHWVRKNRIDVLLTNTATASAIARATDLRVPVVYFCHGLHWDRPSLTNAPFRIAERILLHNTAGIVTLNSDDERWFREHAPHTPHLRLLYGVGLPPGEYPRSRLPSTERAELLWIGELSARKNPLAAISVATNLAELQVPFRLTMLGEGPERGRILHEVRSRSLEHLVQLPGRLPAAPALATANAIIHTATWEGLPRVLLEAVAVGRPVFAFDVKGVRDIPGIRLFSKGDTSSLAGAVAQALTQPSTLEEQVARYPSPLDLSSDRTATLLSNFLTNHILSRTQ